MEVEVMDYKGKVSCFEPRAWGILEDSNLEEQASTFFPQSLEFYCAQ